jgi:ketosteroid isomerase-like protein
MKKLLMLILLVFVCCLGCQQGKEVANVDVEVDIQAIKDSIAEFNGALNAADIDRLMLIYADNAVMIPSNEPAAIGKEAIRTRHQKLFEESSIFSEHREDFLINDVQTSGNLAVANFLWSYNGKLKDVEEPIKTNGNEVWVLQKQPDGACKIIYQMWSNEILVYPPLPE